MNRDDGGAHVLSVWRMAPLMPAPVCAFPIYPSPSRESHVAVYPRPVTGTVRKITSTATEIAA